MGHPLPPCTQRAGAGLPPRPARSNLGGPQGVWEVGGDVAWPGELALQKKSITRLPQAQIHLKQSSKAPPAPPSPGHQSWQVHSLEGCVQGQPGALRDIPGAARTGDHALLPTHLLSGATHQAMLGGSVQTSCHQHLLCPPPMLRDAVAGMLFSPAE